MKNKKKLLLNTLICVLILFIMAITIKPILNNIKFGLDLKGGFEVLYDIEPINGELTSDTVNNTYKTLLKRIDVLGVSEPSITIEGDRIRVGLASVTDKEEARSILGKQASLTFRDTSDNLLMTSEVLKSNAAKMTTDSKGRPAVSLSINNKDEFYRQTSKISQMTDNVIVIWLDFDEDNDSFNNERTMCGAATSNCLSYATVSQGFSSDVIIEGNFTTKQVETLVELINSGSLQAKLNEISSRTVGTEFGEDSLNKTLIAGIVGIGLIMLVITFIYHLAGLISCLSILIYSYLTFLLFYLIGGVLTLPGIAALVIGIGMAIDTCVINFARIKDELKHGSTLQVAFKKGNKNSLLTIIDSNITTFIVALILFIFGESSVKGFATMLMLSIFVTFIVMIYINRWLMNLFVKSNFFNNKLKLFINYKEHKSKATNFDFIKWGFRYTIIAIIVAIIGIVSLCTKGFNLGLDFKGGTSINVKGNEITEESLKLDLNVLKLDLVDIEKITDENYIITVSNVISADDVNKTEEYFDNEYEANTEINVISNVVKRNLIINAFKSLLLASIGIVIYVSLRFKFSYAIGGIVALLHDAFIVVALFSLFNLEVSGIFVAAVLSIVGYSINDTIVTFDRIRENLGKQSKISKDILKQVTNISLKETLNRSIITTLTTLIPVTALVLLGSNEIMNFNIALFIGLIAGTLSSLFMASQLWYLIEKKNILKPKKKKWYEEDTKEEKLVKGINS